MTSTIRQQLAHATHCLSATSPSARLDAELLLCHILNKPRSYLFAWSDALLTTQQSLNFQTLVTQRQQGTPIAYLLGHREFWTLDLLVTPDTLIPRPETELLVELALTHIPIDQTSHILDLGTGSGAIALAIASERPQAVVLACDQSEAALTIAQLNAHTHQLHQVQWLTSSWFSHIPTCSSFHLIVSNPPYIAQDDPHLQQGDVRFEPMTALAAGQDGLDDLRIIIAQAPHYLVAGGWLLLEHGYDQAQAVRELLRQSGFDSIQTQADLAGHDRVTLGQIPSPTP